MTDARKFVLVGPVEAGKSSLFNALLGKTSQVLKTQAVELEPGVGVDTPGEFFSHPRMYHALLQTLIDVDTIVYVHDCQDRDCRIPPGLLDVYGDKQLIGVVTKTDLPGCDPWAAQQLLRDHGITGDIFHVSISDSESIDALRRVLNVSDTNHESRGNA